MKKVLTLKTRWEYYASNIAGLIIMLALIAFCFFLSFDNGRIEFKSVPFLIALLLMIMVPFAIISIFSAMKQVVISDKGLLISYVFKSHTSEVNFSEVIAFKANVSKSETVIRPRRLLDSFSLTLADGRTFEFSRSQFDNYDKLKSICNKAVGR
jgi:hypothetical protein